MSRCCRLPTRKYRIVRGNPRFPRLPPYRAIQISRRPSLLRFLVWSEAVESAVERARWSLAEIGQEKEATNSKRAWRKWRTSAPENESRLHTHIHMRVRACIHSERNAWPVSRARELSASLGPVPGKSNYSKRDRKLLRSRSSLSIYTVRSDLG